MTSMATQSSWLQIPARTVEYVQDVCEDGTIELEKFYLHSEDPPGRKQAMDAIPQEIIDDIIHEILFYNFIRLMSFLIVLLFEKNDDDGY